jgi:hypothetical protein
MADVKRKASRRIAKRGSARAAQATLTTAFITDAGAALPKGVAGFSFRAPSNAVEVFAAEPAKVKALLKGYGEAVAKSRAAGRAVSFQVEVDPSGGATVTPIEESPAPAAVLPAEAPVAPDADLQAALEEARQRGRVRAAEILTGEDMLSADQFAALLGTSRMTVNTKRQNHQVLGLEGVKRGFRFPAWQVDEDGKPFATLPALFERLGGGPWSVYRFLVQAHPELDGLTGREALRRGKADQALEVADSIAQGTFS